MHSKWHKINDIHEHIAIFWSFSDKSCQNWKLQLVHSISGNVYRWCLLTKLPRCKETCGTKCKLSWLPWVIIIQSNKIQVSWLHVHWFSVQKNTLKSPHQGNAFNLIEFEDTLWRPNSLSESHTFSSNSHRIRIPFHRELYDVRRAIWVLWVLRPHWTPQLARKPGA